MSTVNPPETGHTKPRTRIPQPLHVLQVNEALLKLQTLRDLCGLGKTSLYAKIAAGELQVVRLGKRCTRVRASEAQRFLQALTQGESA